MVDDLVDKIVPNESLGIKKSTSLIKIAAVILVVLVAGILGASFYFKSQATEPEPVLNLGGSLPHTEVKSLPIKPAEIDKLPQPLAVATVSAPIVNQTPAMQSPASVTANSAIPQTNSPLPAMNSSAQANVPVVNANKTVDPLSSPTLQPSMQSQMNNTATSTPSPTEGVMSVTEKAAPQIVKVKIVKHKYAAKHSSQKIASVKNMSPVAASQNAHAEEEVSREEIIVIQ